VVVVVHADVAKSASEYSGRRLAQVVEEVAPRCYDDLIASCLT
jgi:hypothetical protein